MFLSRRKRLLAGLVLAAGAAASIATSAAEWSLTAHADLDPVILDESLPSVSYAVHVEYTGKLTDPDGTVSLALIVEREPTATSGGYLHLEVIDEQTGMVSNEEPDWAYDPTITGPQGPSIYADAWLECTDGCSQDYTFTITRTDPITDALWPELRLTGGADAYLSEYGETEPPSDATVSIEVTPL